jgi:hypothetical protein
LNVGIRIIVVGYRYRWQVERRYSGFTRNVPG